VRPRSRNRERDRVGAWRFVRLLDRCAEGAVAGHRRAHAVGAVRVSGSPGAVDREHDPERFIVPTNVRVAASVLGCACATHVSYERLGATIRDP
jgi:hypothetical protein